LKVQVHAQGFKLTTERDLEVRIDLTVYIHTTVYIDLQLRDLQLRLLCIRYGKFITMPMVLPSFTKTKIGNGKVNFHHLLNFIYL